jgi:hypothetical protein
MPKGKPWPAEDEAKLKQLIDEGRPLDVIAAKLGKSKQAIRRKAERLGLKLVGQARRQGTTSSGIKMPKELPSVEEALKILAGALEAASKPGLDRVEVQRLQVVATLARTYKDLLADYIGYRQIEAKLLELEAKYAKLANKAKTEKA